MKRIQYQKFYYGHRHLNIFPRKLEGKMKPKHSYKLVTCARIFSIDIETLRDSRRNKWYSFVGDIETGWNKKEGSNWIKMRSFLIDINRDTMSSHNIEEVLALIYETHERWNHHNFQIIHNWVCLSIFRL